MHSDCARCLRVTMKDVSTAGWTDVVSDSWDRQSFRLRLLWSAETPGAVHHEDTHTGTHTCAVASNETASEMLTVLTR